MNARVRLIRCISLILIVVFITIIFMNVLIINETQAKAQNTKDYKKGSDMLKKYPGYSSLLDNLIKEHPKWTFTILYTGLDWNTVIKNETTIAHGRNLVQNKSGEWVCSVCGDKAYDNGSWRCASASTVSYYMDPRNSLYEDYIFQFENLKWVDGKYTIDGIKQIIDDCGYLQGSKITYTNTSGKTSTINKSYAQVIMDAAKEAGISPYHLASRIRQEQGPGKNASSTATGKYSGYKGYYNFLNVNASGSGSSTIIKNALEYAKKQKWDNPEKSIKGGAKFLAQEYIKYGQNTLYLQKFDVDDSDGDLYWHQYQQNVSAAKTESMDIMETYKDIDSKLNMPFNFVIPVFENMPDTKCAMPGSQSIVTQNIQITDSSVVVYKSKNKTSTKLATLKKGEKILRIEIGSNKENGYVWDKVVLSNGTKGYVISNGFKVIDDITNCETTAIAIDYGNVRNGPGTSGTTVLTTLTIGQRVTIIEKGKYKNVDGYDWSRIILADGTQGYVVSKYLEEVGNDGSTETGEDIVKVVCDGGLTIRKEPGTSSKILGYADTGDYLTRIEKNVSNANGYTWDKIVTDSGMTGYIARGNKDKDYIEPIKETGSSSIKGDGFKTTGSKLMCEPNIKVEEILKKASGATVKNTNGKTVTSGNIGTGYTIKYNGSNYTVVKMGDVNGDGKITSSDYVRVKNELRDKVSLTSSQDKAADANNDGKISSADYVRIKNYLRGKASINI